MFDGATGGSESDITDENATDLWLLSDKFRFPALSTTVADWRSTRLSLDADPTLIAGSLDKRPQLPDGAPGLLEEKIGQPHWPVI
jgi:hypothetical protein